MTNSPYITNVSSIQDYMRCKWRWVAKWVMNRVPKEDARALTFGKLLHNIFEDHFATDADMASIVEKYRSEWVDASLNCEDALDRAIAAAAVEDLDAYGEALIQWRDTLPIEGTLEVEKPFSVLSPFDESVGWRGRPDRVVLLWGRMFHMQHRGLSGVNFLTYTELAKRHLHEHVYAYALQRRYTDKSYGGTIFNLMRKLKFRGVATKKCPEGKILRPINELLWQGIVDISPEQNDAMLREATDYAIEMRETTARVLDGGKWPLPNESLNGGPFGNKIDPYFRVLNGEISLENDAYFKSREDTYSGVTEELL